ncbi:MAG: hypothetical protein QOG03_273 [Actinomycetota bacterium]|nr:hypothetical protein [Actinomycetota bacterium]
MLAIVPVPPATVPLPPAASPLEPDDVVGVVDVVEPAEPATAVVLAVVDDPPPADAVVVVASDAVVDVPRSDEDDEVVTEGEACFEPESFDAFTPSPMRPPTNRRPTRLVRSRSREFRRSPFVVGRGPKASVTAVLRLFGDARARPA